MRVAHTRTHWITALTACVMAGSAGFAGYAGATTTGPSRSSHSATAARVDRPIVGTPTGRILVSYRPGTTATAQAAARVGLGAVAHGHVHDLGVQVLEVPPAAEAHALAVLRSSATVDYAEPDPDATLAGVTPNDPYWSNEWGANRVGAPTAWSTTTGSSGVTVAVLDSGLTPGLAEFAGRVLAGYNFVANSTDTTDDNGHGTDVTGVALAQGNNATGVAGLCWTCRILPVKVSDANGNVAYSAMASGITWATDHGAQVINLSLGGQSASTTLDNAVAYARSHGVVVIAAAGNYSSSAPVYPADSPGAIAVAATDSTDTLYSYSDYGSWVDIAAPGSNYTVSGGGTYFPFGGTSSASPVVAGATALLFAAQPGASGTAVEQALVSTTDPTKGAALGGGRLNVGRAMAALTGTAPAPSPSPTATATSPSPSASPTSPAPSPTATTTSPAPSPSPTATATSPAPSPTPSASTTAPAKGHKK